MGNLKNTITEKQNYHKKIVGPKFTNLKVYPLNWFCYPSQLIIVAVKEILISCCISNLLISFNLTQLKYVCEVQLC